MGRPLLDLAVAGPVPAPPRTIHSVLWATSSDIGSPGSTSPAGASPGAAPSPVPRLGPPGRLPPALLLSLLARLLRCVLAALALTAVVAGPAVAAEAAPAAPADPGGIGIRLVDAPVATRDDPRAHVYIVDHLAPGAVVERRIEVTNTTADNAEIAIYAAAATIEGGSFVGSADRTANDLSSWTSVSPDALEIPAEGSTMATVTIAVPDDAAPGEQYGVVWAEARSEPGEGGGVTHVSRVGIRLYVSVGPGAAPAADFTIDSLTAGRSEDGNPTVEASVRNTGGRALDLSGTLKLSDGPGGLSAGPFDATLGRTLDLDGTAPVSIVLDGQLPAGPWEAEVMLKSGLVERTASATITFPDTGAAAATPTTTDTTSGNGWLVPAAVGAAVLLLAGAGAVSVRTRGRRPSRPSRDVVDQEPREPVLTP